MPVWLVGTAEISDMLGVSRQRVAQLASVPDFPQPTAELTAGRVWLRSAVLQWIGAHPDRLAYTFREATGMFELFSPSARQVVTAAGENARQRQAPAIGSMHLLAVLAGEPSTAAAIRDLGLTEEVLARAMESDDKTSGEAEHLPLDTDAKRAIELSSIVAQNEGSQEVSTAHLLAALSNPDQKRTHPLLSKELGLSARGLDARLHEALGMTGITCSFCEKRFPRLSVVWQGTRERPAAAICASCAELASRSFQEHP